MDGLKPIKPSYITNTPSISTLETFQGRLNRKIEKLAKVPLAQVKRHAETLKKEPLPFKHETSKTPVGNSACNKFTSSVFNGSNAFSRTR